MTQGFYAVERDCNPHSNICTVTLRLPWDAVQKLTPILATAFHNVFVAENERFLINADREKSLAAHRLAVQRRDAELKRQMFWAMVKVHRERLPYSAFCRIACRFPPERMIMKQYNRRAYNMAMRASLRVLRARKTTYQGICARYGISKPTAVKYALMDKQPIFSSCP